MAVVLDDRRTHRPSHPPTLPLNPPPLKTRQRQLRPPGRASVPAASAALRREAWPRAPVRAKIALVFAILEAVVFTGLRILALAVVLALAWGWYRLLMRRERAAGVVIAHAEGQWRRRRHPRPAAWRQDSNTALVAFTAADGAEHEVPFYYQSGVGDDYVEGQAVTVIYQRSNPRNAVIDEGRANYTDMIFATVVVVVFAVWYAVDRLF